MEPKGLSLPAGPTRRHPSSGGGSPASGLRGLGTTPPSNRNGVPKSGSRRPSVGALPSVAEEPAAGDGDPLTDAVACDEAAPREAEPPVDVAAAATVVAGAAGAAAVGSTPRAGIGKKAAKGGVVTKKPGSSTRRKQAAAAKGSKASPSPDVGASEPADVQMAEAGESSADGECAPTLGRGSVTGIPLGVSRLGRLLLMHNVSASDLLRPAPSQSTVTRDAFRANVAALGVQLADTELDEVFGAAVLHDPRLDGSGPGKDRHAKANQKATGDLERTLRRLQVNTTLAIMEAGEDPSRVNIQTGPALAQEARTAADAEGRAERRLSSLADELPIAARLGQILVEKNVRAATPPRHPAPVPARIGMAVRTLLSPRRAAAREGARPESCGDDLRARRG